VKRLVLMEDEVGMVTTGLATNAMSETRELNIETYEESLEIARFSISLIALASFTQMEIVTIVEKVSELVLQAVRVNNPVDKV